MHVVANIDRITASSAAPKDYKIKSRCASGRATIDWRVNGECARYLPNLYIARRIRESCGCGISYSAKGKYLTNTAADMLGSNKVIGRDNRPEKIPELPLVLPTAA